MDGRSEFKQRHATLIYKSGSWLRSLTAKLSEEDTSRLSMLRWCPVVFQEYLDGPNCRAHVLFGEIFPLTFRSEEVDYRVSFPTSQFQVTGIDSETAGCLAATVEASDLGLAGCDLKWSTSREKWILLEVNRMPAIEYYDHVSGNRIADRILTFV